MAARLEVKTWRGRDGTALRLYASREGRAVGWFDPRTDRHELHDRGLYRAFWAAVLAERDRLQSRGELDPPPGSAPSGPGETTSAVGPRPSQGRATWPPSSDTTRGQAAPDPTPPIDNTPASSSTSGSTARAGASAQARYRTLRASRRRVRTLVAAGVALSAGLVAGVALTSWIAAGAAAVAALAALGAIWRARPDQVTAWKKGAKGERRTAKQLRKLERDGWHVAHDLAIPGSRANIDHLAIGPGGVWVIDSKFWDSPKTRVRVSWGHLYYGGRRQDRTLATAAWEARRAEQELTNTAGMAVPVRPLVVLQGGRLLWWTRKLQGVRVIGAHLLLSYLRHRPQRYSETELERVTRAAKSALTPHAGETQRNA